MSTENTVADRLLTDARKKTARQESPTLGKIALIAGVIALLVSPISVLGWIGGATALALGGAAAQRPISLTRGRIAMLLGFTAVLVGVFCFTLNIAQR